MGNVDVDRRHRDNELIMANLQIPDDSPVSAIAQRRMSAKTTTKANYHDRRGEIVSAAATLFKAKGYRGTTLADIAGAIGADRASLYYYISNKEELLDEVVTDVVMANLARAEDIRDSAADAPTKLRQLISELMISYSTNYPFLYVYLQENLAHVAKDREEWSKQMRAVNRRWEAAVEAIIVQGIGEGTLRAISEPRIMAYGVIGMVSWTNRWYNPASSTIDAAAIGAAYAEMARGGMVVAP